MYSILMLYLANIGDISLFGGIHTIPQKRSLRYLAWSILNESLNPGRNEQASVAKSKLAYPITCIYNTIKITRRERNYKP